SFADVRRVGCGDNDGLLSRRARPKRHRRSGDGRRRRSPRRVGERARQGARREPPVEEPLAAFGPSPTYVIHPAHVTISSSSTIRPSTTQRVVPPTSPSTPGGGSLTEIAVT